MLITEITVYSVNENFNSELFKARVKAKQDIKPPQRLVITGSRDFGIDQGPYRDGNPSFPYNTAEYEKDKKFATEILDAWIEKYGVPEVIIHGGAEGADRLVADIAASKGIKLEEVRPNFDLFPKVESSREEISSPDFTILGSSCNSTSVFNSLAITP